MRHMNCWVLGSICDIDTLEMVQRLCCAAHFAKHDYRRTTSVTKLFGELDWPAERHVCHFSPKQQVVALPFLSVIYLSLRDKHAALITQVSSPSLHELMSTNIRSFHAHFSIGTLVCWSPSQVLVVCKRVSWFGRLSHDTPAVKGDAHCWIFAEELKNEEVSSFWYLYLGLPLTSSFLLEYSSEYLNEYSSTR